MQRVIDVAANVDGRDLGGVAKDIQAVIRDVSKDLGITTHIELRGQPEVMNTSFGNLAQGLVIVSVADSSAKGGWDDQIYSERFACPIHPNVSLPELEPRRQQRYQRRQGPPGRQ